MLSPELFLPDEDIDTVLTRQLILLAAGATSKFEVEGHPELLIRRDEDDEQPAEVQVADRGYMNLRLQGVDVLPYAVVERDYGRYVITYKVDGVPLEDFLNSGQGGNITREVDELYSRLGKFLLGAWRDGRETTLDVFGSVQYMYGSVKGGRPGIKLVDLDMTSTSQISSLPGVLAEEAIGIANDIVLAEAALGGQRLMAARETIQGLFDTELETCRSDPMALALVRLGNIVLVSGQATADHESLIDREFLEKYGYGPDL